VEKPTKPKQYKADTSENEADAERNPGLDSAPTSHAEPANGQYQEKCSERAEE
jgi:hypothetical protein